MKSEGDGRRGSATPEHRASAGAAASESGATPRDRMFAVVRRAIERVYAKTRLPVSREAVVAELIEMPETRALLAAGRPNDHGRLEWLALGSLLAFDQSLITGRLPECQASIVRRVAGRRGTWTYECGPPAKPPAHVAELELANGQH